MRKLFIIMGVVLLITLSASTAFAASDDEDYDYIEVYEDEEYAAPDTGEGGQTPDNTVVSQSAQPDTSNAQPASREHIPDDTPKTAPVLPDERYVLCLALLLTGVSLILTRKR